MTFEATVALPPTGLVKVSGDNQRGYTGAELANPFVVEVRDTNGNPLERVTVNFVVTGGDGSLNPESVQTNASGRASSLLTLGNSPGTNTVTVSVAGISGTEVFSAEATLAPPPPMLVKISGDNQIGVPGQTLEPFVVEARRPDGAPMSGAFVIFIPDNGSVNTILGVTGSDGRAEITLTLGDAAGPATVTAQVGAVSVTFEATVILPPSKLMKISGDNQTGYAGTSLGRAFVVEVRDEENNIVGGVTVTFTVTQGGGSLNPETTQTSPAGRARSLLTLGNSPGTNTVTVRVVGVAETVTFTAVGELPEFDLSLQAGLNLIHVPLKVSFIDGMPGTIESVSDLYDALGGRATVNFLITYDSQAQEWRSYFGPSDSGTPADRRLEDDTGVLAGMLASVSVHLAGTPLSPNRASTITLNPGLNLVGLPLRDARINRVSDLLTLPGIAGNVPVIILTDNGEFKLVGRAGDPGDNRITGGGAFILNAREAAAISIFGDPWVNVP